VASLQRNQRVTETPGCASFDDDGDGRVAVNELIAAVGNALRGCPPA
jgi:hypothetical protein